MITGLIAGGVLVLAIIGWSVYLMRRGGDVAEGKIAKKGLDNAALANRIEERNANLSDDAIRKRMFGDDK